MTKLTNAPHLKEAWNNQPYSDLIILAGGNAWSVWNKGKGIEWQMLADALKIEDVTTNNKTISRYNQKPVILGDTQLAEIDRLRIANPEQRFIKIIQCGELTSNQKTALSLNLANHTKADCVGIYDCHSLELVEDLSEYLTRLRTDEASRKLAEMTATAGTISTNESKPNIPDKPTQKEQLKAFLEWIKAPLKRDVFTGQTYQYNGTHWQYFSDEALKRLVLAFFEDCEQDYTQRKINSLAELIITKLDELPTATPDLTAYQNGALNKKTGEFLPLSPSLNLRGLEPFKLTISTHSPHFDNWLYFVTNDGKDKAKERAILAGLYMILTNRHEWQKFLEITGVGGSGKSVLGNIATLLNGSSNTAFIELSQMERKPENRSGLLGKTLIYSPDQPFYSGDADTLKAITGGDMITVKYLYKDPLEIKLDACLMMTTNYPLLFTDRNGGISRRRIVINFNRQVPKEKRDPNFIDKVRSEIYAITNRLLVEFKDPNTANEILENYRLNQEGQEIKRSGNHLIEFTKAFEIKANPHGLRWGSTRARETDPNRPNTLYKAYLFFCDCLNISKPLNLQAFKQAFPDALKENGQTAEINEITLNGYPTLNVHFKQKEDTFKEWEG